MPAETTPRPDRFRAYALAAILAAFAWRARDIFAVLKQQPPGVDYSALWAGARTLADPGRLYDFAYVTALQGWPLGPTELRPFVYPPSSLLVFAPLSAAPYWVSYALFTAASFALFAWAGRRLGAPWWIVVFPVVWLVAVCGQTTFLIGGLTAAALTLPRRPIVAGLLLGAAAAIKPQLLVFIPLALVAEGRWRTLIAAGLAGAAAGLLSIALWGPGLWFEWLAALPRFQQVVMDSPGLLKHAITPYASLERLGLPGALAWALAPFALWLVWRTFRDTEDVADRLIAVFGAAMIVSPYAMHYDAGLMAPAVAAYLARTQARLWPLYAAVACLYTVGLVHDALSLAAPLVLPLASWAERRGWFVNREATSAA